MLANNNRYRLARHNLLLSIEIYAMNLRDFLFYRYCSWLGITRQSSNQNMQFHVPAPVLQQFCKMHQQNIIGLTSGIA